MKLKGLAFLRFFFIAALTGFIISVPQNTFAYDFDAASTYEYIESFHSDITVKSDSSMTVIETITVRSQGNQINHGIYRDFPTMYGSFFRQKKVGFKVLDVKRDGKPEPYHTNREMNGVRIYIGDSNVSLQPGRYTYSITYKTDHQLGYFKDHDELYWNVTGSGWVFPILKASAKVKLPDSVPAKSIKVEGYTGLQGSKEQNYSAGVDNKIAFIKSNKEMEPNEGLSIVVSWEKGHVAKPTLKQELISLIKDDLGIKYSLLGFMLLLIYYFFTWSLVGKDPPKGSIVPQYEPPAGFSPGAVRYLRRMGFDQKCMAANIIEMAVKRFLNIEETGSGYMLCKISDDMSNLTEDEQIAAEKLFAHNDKIILTDSNHQTIRGAWTSVKDNFKKNYQKQYFNTNLMFIIPGILITLLIFAAEILSRDGENRFLAGFMTLWLSFWTLGVATLLSRVVQMWKLARNPGAIIKKAGEIIGAGCLTLFAIPFVAGELFGLYFLTMATSPIFMLILVIVMIVNFIYVKAIKAPTKEGREILDRIDGFKEYLSRAESDNLQMFKGPEITPALFERFLPYALALDVEQAWSQKFAHTFEAAGMKPDSEYSPVWYSGTALAGLSTGAFASSIGSSMSSAISSSSTAPGSSSGSGGGGSSGGGGGGGGGGGW